MPKSPIRKFFMGISWIDPNVRYFREMGKMQAQRTREDMDCWTCPEEIKLALAAGDIYMRCARWQKPYFFPLDSFEAMWLGPEPFSWRATDADLEIVEEIGCWLRRFGIDLSGEQLGHFLEREIFGEFVDAVLRCRDFKRSDYSGSRYECNS